MALWLRTDGKNLDSVPICPAHCFFQRGKSLGLVSFRSAAFLADWLMAPPPA